MLEDLGCRVTVVENGRLAVEAIARERFDLVVMDCQMPELDGFAATRLIRAREAESRHAAESAPLPIVAVTAHAMEGDRERCFEAGMDDHLTKPFSRANLVGMIERWVVRPERASAQAVAASSAIEIEQDGRELDGAQGERGPLDPAALDELAAIPGADASGLVARVIGLYLKTSYPLGAVIRAAVERWDAEALASAAHRLSSGSAEVGANSLAALCKKLEVKARSGALEGVGTLGSALEAELERVRLALLSRLE